MLVHVCSVLNGQAQIQLIQLLTMNMSTELIWQKGNNTAEGTQMFIYEKDYVNESIN